MILPRLLRRALGAALRRKLRQHNSINNTKYCFLFDCFSCLSIYSRLVSDSFLWKSFTISLVWM